VLTTPLARFLMLPLNTVWDPKLVKALTDSPPDLVLMRLKAEEVMKSMPLLTQWPQDPPTMAIRLASQALVLMTKLPESKTTPALTIESVVPRGMVCTNPPLLQDLEPTALVLKAHTTVNLDLSTDSDPNKEVVSTCPRPLPDLVNTPLEENLRAPERATVWFLDVLTAPICQGLELLDLVLMLPPLPISPRDLLTEWEVPQETVPLATELEALDPALTTLVNQRAIRTSRLEPVLEAL